MKLPNEAIVPYITAGNATVIIKSRIDSYAFKIKKNENGTFFFVYYKGQETQYIGFIYVNNGRYYFTFRPKGECELNIDSKAVKAFHYFINGINANDFGIIEVWHDGQCGKCGRPLTDPISIETGLGPICAKGGR